jgi:hypothetical protein
MLTRHLYSHDEVAAALLWSIRCKRIVEAAFWVKEMIDTELFDELYNTLFNAWIWYFGIAHLTALTHLYELFHKEQETTEEEIIRFVTGLCGLNRDASVFALLTMGATDGIRQPDHFHEVSKLAGFFDNEVCSELEIAAFSALWQKKIRLAWWFMRSLWLQDADRMWVLLDKLAEMKLGSDIKEVFRLLKSDRVSQWASRALAFCCFGLDKKTFKKSLEPFVKATIPDYLNVHLESWRKLEGQRARRIYAIPHASLYWLTQRGKMNHKKTNLQGVYCGKWQSLRGSPFWERVLAEEEPWADDTKKEHFWETYFPDDIPDEWSLEDQQKSHGEGALIGDETPSYLKYSSKWFNQCETRSLWMGVSNALNSIEKRDDWIEGWDTLYAVDPEQDLDLEPKKVHLFIA